MFEIGTSLREARLRQGIDFARVEAETRIRAKYVQALEDERFEVLPAETYVKGFLRTYAEYLGLDGQLYVDEFNSRFASAEEPPVASRPSSRPRSRRESSFVVVALAGIVAVAVLVVVAFAFSNERSQDPAAELGSKRAESTARAGAGGGTAGTATTAGKRQRLRARAAPKVANVVLTATRGNCWVAVHRGSAVGEVVFSGTIYQGESQRFRGRRLALEFGAAPAENLDVTLNGRRVRNFPSDASIVLVTPRGVRAQA